MNNFLKISEFLNIFIGFNLFDTKLNATFGNKEVSISKSGDTAAMPPIIYGINVLSLKTVDATAADIKLPVIKCVFLAL